MVSRRSVLRYTGGYGFSVVLSGLLSIAVIPIVIILAGDAVWATIAVAQAVAGFGFVIVAGGWGVTGPTATAACPDAERGAFYADSLVTRSWLFVLALIPAVAIAVSLTFGHPLIAAVTTATGLLPGLSGGWFFVGEGSPIRFLVFETLPRTAGTAIGATALILSHDALWFVTIQGLGALVAAAASTVSILRRYRGWHVVTAPVRALSTLKGQSSAMSMAATSSIYVNLPIVVVQVFLPHATALYALAERIMRLALYSTRPFVQVSQGYVPNPVPALQARRAAKVVRFAVGFSVAGGLAYALAAPLAGDLLSGGGLHIPFALSIPMSVALAAMLLSQITGFACLTAFGLTRTLALSTVAGAIVGAALLIPLALAAGLVGLASALAASEVVVFIVQAVRLRPYLSATPPSAEG